MAEVPITELIAALKEHPKYPTEWDNGAPAERALYIRFGVRGRPVTHRAETAADGRTIVIDRDPETGHIVGIEIVG